MRAVVCILALVFVSVASAQSDRGVITGTVSDQAGAVIAGAPVTARHIESGGLFVGATSDTGNYTLSQLPPGAYELTVTSPGFRSFTQTGITVQVATTLRIDVTMQVGAAAESVTVTADAPLLKTESGDLAHNVETSNLNALPILGVGGTASGSAGIRNPNAVVRMVPGAYWEPNRNVKINGAPMNTQSFRIEGQEAQNTGTSGVPQQNQPSVDAIEEIAIQTSNYAAEYGQAGGGYMNITMKSGTNAYHGTVYEYLINEAFGAGTPFTDNGQGGNTRPRERRHDFGGTIGGPLWFPGIYDGHDKTWFFVNFERFQESALLNNIQGTVPVAEYRNGNFNRALLPNVVGTDPLGNEMLAGMVFDPTTNQVVNGRTVRAQFPNNTVPVSRFDPIAAKIQNLVPLPQGPTANGLTNNYVNPVKSRRITEIPSFKLDHQMGTRARVSFMWQRTYTGTGQSLPFGRPDGLPDPITESIGTYTTAPLLRMNFDYTVSPTMLLHLGAGYRETKFFVPSVTLEDTLTDYDIEAELGLKGGQTHRFFSPMSGMLSANGQGGLKNIGSDSGNINYTQSPTFNANMTWVKGNHTYKWGAEFRTEGYPVQGYSGTDGRYGFAAEQTGQPFQLNAVSGFNVGFPYASFLLGLVDNVTMNNPVFPRIGKSQTGLFLQDTWKVTRDLTLDIGLRYDYSTYLQESYGRGPLFSATTIHPLAGIPGASVYDKSGPGRCNCSLANNYPWGFGPRIGVAWQHDSKTVVRGGFAVVYSGTAGNNNAAGGLAGSSANTPNADFGTWVTTLSQGIDPSMYPQPWPVFDAGQFPTAFPTPGTPPRYFDQNAGRPARQYQWSIGVQREISSNFVMEAAYVANRGVWWPAPGLIDVNAIPFSRLASYGLDLSNPDDRTLLSSRLSSTIAQQRGLGNGLPYAGFPATQTVAQAIRPFPQFTTFSNMWPALGKTWYDSLQIKATKRLSHGLQLGSTFTWSRNLVIGAEREVNFGTDPSGVVNDVFNYASNKHLSNFDIPFQFILTATYTTPQTNFGHAILDYALSDWTYGLLLNYQSGLPIAAPLANNNPSLNSLVFQSTYANRVPGEPLFTVPDLNCHCYDAQSTFVLNPNAWVDPPDGQFGAGPIFFTDYRAQRRPVENMTFGRTFRFTETVNLNVRMELNNIFNRAFWQDPTSTNAAQPQLRRGNGTTISGFGRINVAQGTSAIQQQPRNGTLVVRLTF